MFDESKKVKGTKTATVENTGINEPISSDADNFLADSPKETPTVITPFDENKEVGVTVERLEPFALSASFVQGLFAEGEKKETASLQEITSAYLDLNEFKMGEERNYICTGETTFVTESGEVKPAIKLMDKERKSYILGSTVAVQSYKRLSKIPTLIRIKVNGKEKGKNGSYYALQMFEI